MDAVTRFVLAQDVLLQELSVREPAFWCFNTASGDCFRLNETSYAFLKCFDVAVSFDAALERFRGRVVSLPDEAATELREFFQRCVELSVLVQP